MKKTALYLVSVICLLNLWGCAQLPTQTGVADEEQLQTSLWAKNSVQTDDVAAVPAQSASQGWRIWQLPGKKTTRFSYAVKDGRAAIAAQAVSSASMLRKAVRKEANALGKLKFSWKVPALIAKADMTQRETEDSPVRVVLAFEGDRSKFSTKNAMLSELSRALTGEEMPYATLMYVWGNQPEVGSVLINPRTDRIRKMVVESGSQNLNQWMEYERDIRADYKKAFGEEPGALIGVGIMTDTDNTESSANAWYGPLQLSAQ